LGKEKIWIFDTTLRDGEQAPGASMSIEEKIKIAHALAGLKVDIIEAGFPVSSPAQFDACKQISREVKGPVIAGLARAVEKDIERCYEALKEAKRSRIHTFIATSPIHMEHKLQMKPDQVLKNAVKAVSLAKSMTNDVEFSAEDASRTEKPFLAEITQAVIEAGATVVNIPDTVGYTVPQEFYDIVTYLKKNVPNIEDTILSVHCHNDLGLAVANSLSACLAGARQVECTINGIGERAGNAAMEELVMAMKVRKDFFPFDTDIEISRIYPSSKMVSRIVGYPVQPNKAIVGKNAFAHESGIHQDGVLKNPETYEIMRPSSIGRTTGELILGRHSGKAGFKSKIKELGLELSSRELETAYERFLEIADKRKEVTDEDIIAILGESGLVKKGYQLEYMTAVTGEKVIPTATVQIKRDEIDYQASAIGDGPIDAAYKAVNKAINLKDVQLEDFNIQSISSGKDAMGQVSVHVKINKMVATGVAMDTDIILAGTRAYLNAINKIIFKQGRNLDNEVLEEGI
jgi:2-isopropylmalate synthase